MPEVVKCVSCGSKEKLEYFSIKDNGIKCENCSKFDKSVIRINNSTLYAIRYIVMSDAKKLFSFSIPNSSVEELKLVSKVYLEEKLEKGYRFDKVIQSKK